MPDDGISPVSNLFIHCFARSLEISIFVGVFVNIGSPKCSFRSMWLRPQPALRNLNGWRWYDDGQQAECDQDRAFLLLWLRCLVEDLTE